MFNKFQKLKKKFNKQKKNGIDITVFHFKTLYNPIFKTFIALHNIMKTEISLQMPLTCYVHAGCACRKKRQQMSEFDVRHSDRYDSQSEQQIDKKSGTMLILVHSESPTKRFIDQKCL